MAESGININRLLNDLRKKQEMDPDEHDGSYELVRETVNAYAKLKDYSPCTINDLNAIYLMAIGTWRHSIAKKKDCIWLSCLPDEEKTYLCSVIDRIWANACNSRYECQAKEDRPTLGMFGTGFCSFKGKSNDECARRFIMMCVDIAGMDDSELVYKRCSEVLNRSFKGMKAASASAVLHCLKPTVFPIINGHEGNNSIYLALGIDLCSPEEVYTYISNCRKIRTFRDQNFSFKNYRILDIASWSLDNYMDCEKESQTAGKQAWENTDTRTENAELNGIVDSLAQTARRSGKKDESSINPLENPELIAAMYAGIGYGEPEDPVRHKEDTFLLGTTVAGADHVQNIGLLYDSLEPGDRLQLLREPNNEYDERAILVKTADGAKLGYVPFVNNLILSRLMDAGNELYAVAALKRIEPGGRHTIAIRIFMADGMGTPESNSENSSWRWNLFCF